MKEYFFQCVYCWKVISVLIDLSQSEQNYIEDCERCCNPMQLRIKVQNQEISEFEVTNIEQ